MGDDLAHDAGQGLAIEIPLQRPAEPLGRPGFRRGCAMEDNELQGEMGEDMLHQAGQAAPFRGRGGALLKK